MVATCCTIPVGAGATVAAELNGYLESYGYTNFVVGLGDAALARTPLLILCAAYCIFFAPKFAPDQPTMFKMSWRPAILFTVVAVAWTMTLFPIL